jgi:class I fructose-bisphosphate aldolase
MMSYRLNRLFNPVSGRMLDVAIDHGFFGEHSFLKGIEDIEQSVRTLVAARPDAIQLTPGQAPVLQRLPLRDKPALVLRTDVANIYGNQLEDHIFSVHFPDAVEQAIRLDAACVVANLLHLPGRPEVREQCIRTIMDLRVQTAKYDIPLMVEPLVMRDNSEAGGYMVDGNTAKIVALVRQAKELGADLIKADPTDDVSEYHQVVTAAGDVPVLVRGGGRTSDEVILERTYQLLQQGARGIVYGRNIIQHRDPAGITAALMGILHEDLSVSEALQRIGSATS